ncbi:MAG TPA: glycosyltransferase family 2 protein [Bacteroidia bacterium]|nr:glycosyltransferase family 2 protein [Bacteroidia bacterium]
MLYSIVIPVYNSEKIIEKTISKTIDFFNRNKLEFELILINDGSKDKVWQKLKTLAEQNKKIIAINFLKNYGQHTAVMCGITHGTGDYFITMDDDLQNPPEEIIKLIEKINEGYDVVFGKFPVKHHGLARKIGSKIIGYLNSKIFNKPNHITLSNFRIFNKAVAERIKNFKTSYPYIPGLLLLHSSSIANVYTEHLPRESGKSNYSLFTIIKLVSRLLFNYSSYPLNLLASFGFIFSFFSFVAGAAYIIKSVFLGTNVQGWTTIVVLLSFLNGFIIIMLGVLGEYVARIMNQLSVGNSYHIQEIINNEK